jgi:hypothetical protein
VFDILLFLPASADQSGRPSVYSGAGECAMHAKSSAAMRAQKGSMEYAHKKRAAEAAPIEECVGSQPLRLVAAGLPRSWITSKLIF